jgi:hypothetical protein
MSKFKYIIMFAFLTSIINLGSIVLIFLGGYSYSKIDLAPLIFFWLKFSYDFSFCTILEN